MTLIKKTLRLISLTVLFATVFFLVGGTVSLEPTIKNGSDNIHIFNFSANSSVVVCGSIEYRLAQMAANTLNELNRTRTTDVVIEPFIMCDIGHHLWVAIPPANRVRTVHREFPTSPRCARITYDAVRCSFSTCRVTSNLVHAVQRITCPPPWNC
ncbi:MAG: hypothetical protein FWF76_01015 [Oscillospiraceae bacterium]|nr:hypothetical protein [Oscillospiraceae bacterium]